QVMAVIIAACYRRCVTSEFSQKVLSRLFGTIAAYGSILNVLTLYVRVIYNQHDSPWSIYHLLTVNLPSQGWFHDYQAFWLVTLTYYLCTTYEIRPDLPWWIQYTNPLKSPILLLFLLGDPCVIITWMLLTTQKETMTSARQSIFLIVLLGCV